MTSATRRISVVGPSGSGKSHLCRTIAAQTALPLHELDHVRSDSGGGARSRADFIAAASEIAKRDDWIIDGHYRDVRQIVWARAEAVIWLNYPVSLVVWRLLRRVLRRKLARGWAGKTDYHSARPSESSPMARPQTAASWPKRWNRLRNTLRERREYEALLRSKNYPGIDLVELTSLRKTRRWLTTLERDAATRGSASSQASPDISPTVIVCLFGLPGAGKTTLTDALAPGPSYQSRLEIANKWQKLSAYRKLGFALQAFTDWALLRAALRFGVAARLFKPESIWRLIRLMVMKHWWRSHSGILLFDQGIIQNIWSILYASGRTSPDPAFIAPLIKSTYEGIETQIVLIEVDAELSARRIIGRSQGSSRFDGLPFNDVTAQVASGASLVDAIVTAARIAGVNVCTLDGTKPVAALAMQLHELLLNLGRSVTDSGGCQQQSLRNVGT